AQLLDEWILLHKGRLAHGRPCHGRELRGARGFRAELRDERILRRKVLRRPEAVGLRGRVRRLWARGRSGGGGGRRDRRRSSAAPVEPLQRLRPLEREHPQENDAADGEQDLLLLRPRGALGLVLALALPVADDLHRHQPAAVVVVVVVVVSVVVAPSVVVSVPSGPRPPPPAEGG